MKRIFLQYMRPYYARMVLGFMIKFIGTLMDLFLPWTLAHMIDEVIPEGKMNQIFFWGFFMMVCSILAVTFNIMANRMAARVSGDATYALREDLFEKTMYLSNRRMDQMTRPSLISRLTSDTYNVYQMLSKVQRLGVRAPILLLGGLTMTLLMDPALSLVLMSTLPLLTLVVVLVSKKSIPMYSVLQNHVDRFVRLVREDIAGIRVIKALSKEDYERQRFDQVNRDVVVQERKAVMTASVTNPAMNVLLNLGLVGVICVGAVRVSRGLSQVGTILAFMTYFTIILNALLSISRMFTLISKAAASGDRILAVLEAEDERDLMLLETEEADDGAVNTGEAKGDAPVLEFCDVTFSYNQKRNNLEHISFSVNKGETLGIIGATGAGKTTILNLLLRFYDADSGFIGIDGRDIRSLERKELRSRFGVALQNDSIFEDTSGRFQRKRPGRRQPAPRRRNLSGKRAA